MQIRMLSVVQDLQVVVFEIATPNFGFSTGSWVGRRMFLFWKKILKKKKNSKKPLKNLKNPVEKEQFKTDFQYLWRFGNFWSVEKNIFFGFFKKVIFGLFRAILNFFGIRQKWGWPRFFIFCFYRWNKLTGEVCACLDLSKSHFWPF